MKTLEPKDVAVLAAMNEKDFAFMKTNANERRAWDLSVEGLAERKMLPYSMSGGGARVRFKHGYRRTAAGTRTLEADQAFDRARHVRG